MRRLVLSAMFVLAAGGLTSWYLDRGDQNAARVVSFVEHGILDPSMPSYRFAEHVKRKPGELAKLDQGIVALAGGRYPQAIFAHWDQFQAYATCSGESSVVCEVSYFDYADGEIRRYVLPLDAAMNHDHLVDLADPSSSASKAAVQVGAAAPAIKNRNTPSSGFAHSLTYGPPTLREVQPGMIAVYVAQWDYPYSIYTSGPGFEAHGGCAKRVTVGCWVTFFDYKTGEIRDRLLHLEDAMEMTTYVNLLNPQKGEP